MRPHVLDDGYKYLAIVILKNICLDKTDRDVIRKVVFALDMTDNVVLQDMNTKWSDQQKLEANMIYLVTKYAAIQSELVRDCKDVEAAKLLELPYSNLHTEKKYTPAEQKAELRLDPNVAASLESRRLADLLCDSLDRLFGSVLRRNKKLEHINNNYKRELDADKNSE